jgi:glycerate 2-kinase
VPVTVRGPLGDPVEGAVLVDGATAYVESAQACGLHLTRRHDPERATTYGVGELLLAARDAGARRIVVGLGGSGTSDGGAGLLAALGARADRPLDGGVAGLAGLARLEFPRPLDGVELITASDVDNPLTGPYGAIRVFGRQKGIAADQEEHWDEVLGELSAAAGPAGPAIARRSGAGAAGGLGFALLLLGASRRAGAEVVAEAVGLRARAGAADLVVTGEGSFDAQSGAGKAPAGVARVAREAGRPCVLLAGRVTVGPSELRGLGVETAYALVDEVGEERALGDSAAALAELAERVARSRSRG